MPHFLVMYSHYTFVLLTRELYTHYVKETIIIPQYNDADEQIDHVSSPNMAVVHTWALHIVCVLFSHLIQTLRASGTNIFRTTKPYYRLIMMQGVVTCVHWMDTT